MVTLARPGSVPQQRALLLGGSFFGMAATVIVTVNGTVPDLEGDTFRFVPMSKDLRCFCFIVSAHLAGHDFVPHLFI